MKRVFTSKEVRNILLNLQAMPPFDHKEFPEKWDVYKDTLSVAIQQFKEEPE